MNRKYHHKKTRTNKNKQKQTKANESKQKQTKVNETNQQNIKQTKKIKDNQRNKHIRPQDLIYSRLFLKVTGLFLLLSLGTDGSRIVTPRG